MVFEVTPPVPLITKILRQPAQVLRQFMGVFIYLCCWWGVSLFVCSRGLVDKSGQKYFDNYMDAYFDLYVLMTSANYPDIM